MFNIKINNVMDEKLAKEQLIESIIEMCGYLWEQATLEVEEHDTWVFVNTDFIKLNTDMISIFARQQSDLEDEDEDELNIEKVLETIKSEINDLFKDEDYFRFKSAHDYDEDMLNKFYSELAKRNLIKIEEYSITELF